MREAIILAGGLGTRLASVVEDRPKAMALIAGRPFLEWQLDFLRSQGIGRIVLAVGHLGGQIAQHFGERYHEIIIDYEVETAPLGTGGALRRAIERIEGAGAFVFNGDTLLLQDLAALEGLVDDRMVIAVREVDDCRRYGALRIDQGRVTAIFEKGRTGPGHVNAGTYWCHRRVFAGLDLPDAFSLELDVLQPHVRVLLPRAVVSTGFFLDIGLPESYRQAQLSIPEALERFARA